MKKNGTAEAAFSSQKRCLEKWETQQRDWGSLASRLAAKAGKLEEEVLYNRMHHWRERCEELDLLQASVPQAARATESGWEMSLRDSGGDGVRYVKYGSDYPYALYCPIKNTDNQSPDSNVYMRVIAPNASTAMQRQTMKESSGYFQMREKQFSKHVAKKFPHLQHDPDNELLCVYGQPPAYTTEKVDETVTAPIQQYKFVKEGEAEREEVEVVETPQAPDEALLVPADGAQVAAMPAPPADHKGPLLLLAADRIHFSTEPNYLAHSPLRATNLGTTAIFYSWKQLPTDQIANSRGEAVPFNDKPSTFTLSESHSGVLLPGEVHFFAFSFRSTKPCVTSERWELQTVPSGKDKIIIHLRGVTIARERDPLAVQVLSGAFDELVLESPRRRMSGERPQRVATPEPVDESAARRARFDRENAQVGLHYSEKMYRDFEVFYESLQKAVHHPYEVDPFYAAPWNGSVADMELQIERIPFPALKEEFIAAFGLLVDAAAHDHEETDLGEWSDSYPYHYSICYDIVGRLVDDVVSSAFCLQEQLGIIEAPPRGGGAKGGKAAKAPPKKSGRSVSTAVPMPDSTALFKPAFEASVGCRVSDALDQVFDGCGYEVQRLNMILKRPDDLLDKIVVTKPEPEEPPAQEEPEAPESESGAGKAGGDAKMDKSDRDSAGKTPAESMREENTEAAVTEQETKDDRDEEIEEDEEVEED